MSWEEGSATVRQSRGHRPCLVVAYVLYYLPLTADYS